MAIERERKFLVDPAVLQEDPTYLDAYQCNRAYLTQGYLSEKPVVRVRTHRGASFDKGFLTVKGPTSADGVEQPEFEYPVPLSDAEQMLGMCGTRLTKYRTGLCDVDDYKWWVVDEFDGDLTGLWLAEIELKSADETFCRPVWLGAEVTSDPRYKNVALARSRTVPKP